MIWVWRRRGWVADRRLAFVFDRLEAGFGINSLRADGWCSSITSEDSKVGMYIHTYICMYEHGMSVRICMYVRMYVCTVLCIQYYNYTVRSTIAIAMKTEGKGRVL